MNIKPLADRVLILPAPAEEKTIGGIIIPDTAKEKPLKGEVVAVGHGTKDEEMVLKVGDTVLYGAPHITKDGVTVAKEIELADAYQNTGAQLVKEVASKTGDDAGDGTTTATVLAQAIVAEGLKNVTAGASPMDIKRGIDKAVAKVVESIRDQAETVGCLLYTSFRLATQGPTNTTLASGCFSLAIRAA